MPVLADNYQYLVVGDRSLAAVDPAEAAPILAEARKRGLPLTEILITHEHTDHIAGVPELVRATGAKVIRPPLADGDSVRAAGADFDVLDTPGHGRDHVSYYHEDEGILFCGDILFGAGCGRLQGNPPERMFRSLRKLAELPDQTRVYFGHEYTRDNLRFALTAEPDNEAIGLRLDALGIPSSPTTIGLEKQTNPFLRSRSVEEFAERRRRKDVFA